MSKKHLVCQGALCQCSFGTVPDKLVVLSQQKIFINEEEASEKLVATTLEIGPTFEQNTFGVCAVTKSSCTPNITQWDGFYDKVTLPNGGNPLLEDSMGTCAIGGAPSVQITFHGQIATPTAANEQAPPAVAPLINALGSAPKKTKYPLGIPQDS